MNSNTHSKLYLLSALCLAVSKAAPLLTCYVSSTHLAGTSPGVVTFAKQTNPLLGSYSYGYELTLAASGNCYQYFFYNFAIYWSASVTTITANSMPFTIVGTTCTPPTWAIASATALTNNLDVFTSTDTWGSSTAACAYTVKIANSDASNPAIAYILTN